MKVLQHFIHWLALVLLVAATLTGCSSGPQAYNVVVSIDQESWPKVVPTVEVDIVALSDEVIKREAWDTMPLSNYFRPETEENERRSRYYSRKKLYRMIFGEKKDRTQTLSIDNEQWKTWLDDRATQLIVIADLPGGQEKWGGTQGNDLRRYPVPLDSSRWDSDTIEFELDKYGVQLKTPMNKPE